MRRIIVSALVLMFVGSASAGQVDVQPDDFSFGSMVAGDTYKQDLTVSWSGDAPTAVLFNATVEGESTNSNGVNVSFSPERLALLPGETGTTEMVVSTDTALKPDNFTVTPKAYTSVSKDTSDGGSDEVVYIGTVDEGNESVNGSVNESDNVSMLRDKLEEKDDEVSSLKQLIEEYKGTIDSLNETVSNLSASSTEGSTEKDTPGFVYFVLLVYALVASLVLAYLNRGYIKDFLS